MFFSAAGNAREGAKKSGLDMEKYFSFVLPRAALGVGAQWTEEYEVELDHGMAPVVRHHELVSLDGHIATIETRFELEDEPRFVKIEGLPKGAHAWRSEMKSSGSFVAELDLFAPPPLRVSTEMVVRTTVEIRRGQDVLKVITTTLESAFTVEPLDSAR